MTGFVISQLLSNAAKESGGYARPNNFQVEITRPKILAMEDKWLRRLSMNCFASTIPGTTFTTMSEEMGGAPRIITPVSPEFMELPLNFMLSDDMMELAFFEAWHDKIIDKKTGNLEYQSEYATDVIIKKLTRQSGQKITGQWRLMDAWPSSVGDVQLSFDMQNQIAYLPVTIVYRVKVISDTKLESELRKT